MVMKNIFFVKQKINILPKTLKIGYKKTLPRRMWRKRFFVFKSN